MIYVLAPGAEQPRSIPRKTTGDLELELAGGRLATRTGDPFGDRTFDVDGRIVPAQRSTFGWAFDGTRLAWVAEPCALPVVQVWDLSTEPPPPAAGERCIRARIDRDRIRLNRKGSAVTVRLTCPPTPVRACAGEVGADLFAGSRRLAGSGDLPNRRRHDQHRAFAHRGPGQAARRPPPRRALEGRQPQRPSHHRTPACARVRRAPHQRALQRAAAGRRVRRVALAVAVLAHR